MSQLGVAPISEADSSRSREDAQSIMQARLASLVENADEPILSTDLNGRITSWNAAAERLFGFNSAEAIGQPLTVIVPAELQAQEQRLVTRSARGERVEQLETVYVTRHGGRIDVLVTTSPMRDEAGRTTGLSKIIRDIRGRKQAEAQLQESRNRLAMAQRAGRVGVFDWDMANGKEFWTEELEELLGLAPGTFEGNHEGWARRVVPQDLRRLETMFRQCMDEGRTRLDFDFRMRRADGAERWFASRAEIIYDPSGKPLRMIGTNADITDRKRAEEALRREAALIDLTPTAMLVRGPEGDIRLWNKAAEVLYGWKAEQAVGHSTHELLRTEFPEPFDQILKTLAQTGRWSGELRHQTRDGKSLVVQSWWLAELGPQGDVFEILESNLDVTERKRFQKELEGLVAERTAKLRETVADLEHFSYTITHDMRAPLRAMQAFGQMLQMDYQERLDDVGRDYLRRIIESSRRMDHLITDALSYAKVVKQEMELSPVNPEPLLNGMVHSYPEFQPPKADIQIQEGIPWVLGNQAGLTQCFSNLLGNAVKFVEPGKQPKVRVWGERRGKWVRLWIEDNGIGISPAGQTRIFAMFQRLSKDHEGTGIGLALVKKVVERMRGRTGVESELGKGSRFWVELKSAPPPANIA